MPAGKCCCCKDCKARAPPPPGLPVGSLGERATSGAASDAVGSPGVEAQLALFPFAAYGRFLMAISAVSTNVYQGLLSVLEPLPGMPLQLLPTFLAFVNCVGI